MKQQNKNGLDNCRSVTVTKQLKHVLLILYHLNQFDRSQVTGPLDLSKCHMCPGSQVPLTKSPGETPKNCFFGKIIDIIFEGLTMACCIFF